MAIYLSVRAGPTPDQSVPLFTVSDERVITALLAELKAVIDDESALMWVPKARPARSRRSALRAVVGTEGTGE